MIKSVFIIICLLVSCTMRKPKDDISHIPSSFEYMYRTFSGQRFPFIPGELKKGMTIPLFLSKENEPVWDSLVTQKIYDNNLLAFVPSQLKTISLIYVRQDDVHISFIDADSLHIVREIQFHRIDSLSQ